MISARKNVAFQLNMYDKTIRIVLSLLKGDTVYASTSYVNAYRATLIILNLLLSNV